MPDDLPTRADRLKRRLLNQRQSLSVMGDKVLADHARRELDEDLATVDDLVEAYLLGEVRGHG